MTKQTSKVVFKKSNNLRGDLKNATGSCAFYSNEIKKLCDHFKTFCDYHNDDLIIDIKNKVITLLNKDTETIINQLHEDDPILESDDIIELPYNTLDVNCGVNIHRSCSILRTERSALEKICQALKILPTTTPSTTTTEPTTTTKTTTTKSTTTPSTTTTEPTTNIETSSKESFFYDTTESFGEDYSDDWITEDVTDIYGNNTDFSNIRTERSVNNIASSQSTNEISTTTIRYIGNGENSNGLPIIGLVLGIIALIGLIGAIGYSCYKNVVCFNNFLRCKSNKESENCENHETNDLSKIKSNYVTLGDHEDYEMSTI